MGQSVSVAEPDFVFSKFLFTPLEKHRFECESLNRQAGIGIVLASWDGERYFVRRLDECGPAFRSGKIMLWDQLLSVDGTPVKGIKGEALCGLIRGSPGIFATLCLQRATSENTFEVTIERQVRGGVANELMRFLQGGLKATMSDTRIGGELLEVPPFVKPENVDPNNAYERPTYLIV